MAAVGCMSAQNGKAATFKASKLSSRANVARAVSVSRNANSGKQCVIATFRLETRTINQFPFDWPKKHAVDSYF
jgi:hypothetical protein